MQRRAALAGSSAHPPAPTADRFGQVRSWRGLSALLLLAVVIATLTIPRATAPTPAPSVPASPGATHSSATIWAQLPALAQLAVSRGIGSQEPAYWATPLRGGAVAAHEGALSARFTATGITVGSSHGTLALSLRAVRANGTALPVAAVRPSARANRVTYQRGPISEWYAGGPVGLEQGFTVSSAVSASASRSLTFSLALHAGAGLTVRARHGAVAVLSGSHAVLRYGGLHAVDAAGATLPSRLVLRGRDVSLQVDTRRARFPVYVDPIVQDATLSAGDGMGGDAFGQAAAASGSTIAIGAPSATVNGMSAAGAVYVFTEPAGGWATANGAVKLTAATPATSAALGQSVAISGSTVFAGAPGAMVGANASGAVYLFNEPAGGWASENESGQLAEPAATAAGGDDFGAAMAAWGRTVVVGAPLSMSSDGSVYVFNEPTSGWAGESATATLTSTSVGLTGLGFSVAINGSTIVAGAPIYGLLTGQVDVYTEPAGGWTSMTQTALLSTAAATAGNGGSSALGQTVGVYGNTVIAGAPGTTVGANTSQGAVYVYNKPCGGWTGANESGELTASDGSAGDGFGTELVVSGPTILVSSPSSTVNGNNDQGKVYVFTEPDAAGAWSQSAIVTESAGAANDSFGSSLAAAAGGTSFVAGANGGGSSTTAPAGAGIATVFGGIATGATGTSGTTGCGTTGPTTTTGPSGTTGPAGSARQYATVTNISGRAGFVSLAVSCPAATGKCTAANVELVVQEKLSGSRLLATVAKAKKPKITYKRVDIGDGHVTLPAGRHATLNVYLNPLGRKLLGTHMSISVGVSATSVGRTLRLATVTVRHAPARKKTAKPGGKAKAKATKPKVKR